MEPQEFHTFLLCTPELMRIAWDTARSLIVRQASATIPGAVGTLAISREVPPVAGLARDLATCEIRRENGYFTRTRVFSPASRASHEISRTFSPGMHIYAYLHKLTRTSFTLVVKLCSQHRFPLELVGNMDETPLYSTRLR